MEKTYEKILEDYETKGIIPMAKIMSYGKWKEGHRPRQCPYCKTIFSVNLAKDSDHTIHCPVCCMEIIYQEEN
jgi:hypothetical protein